MLKNVSEHDLDRVQKLLLLHKHNTSMMSMSSVCLLFFEAHQQVLNQRLDILGGLRGRRVVRRQLDECSQEILTLLDVLLHFL